MIQLPRFIAHRGASFSAPENTLAAFMQAQKLGAEWIECDVAFTADGQPVIFHDDELSRTSNGYGKLADKPYSLLANLDIGSWFGEAFSDQRILTLTEVLQACQKLQLGINLEIKPQHFKCQQKFSRILADVLYVWEAGFHNILISSFSIRPLVFFMERAPQIPRALLMHFLRPDWRYFANYLECVSVNIKRAIATPELIQAIKQQGFAAMCYTVNDIDDAEHLFAMGVDGVFTDVLFGVKESQ